MEDLQEFPTPDHLVLTPERIAANVAQQKEWREKAATAPFSPVLAEKARAARIEGDARFCLRILGAQLKDAIYVLDQEAILAAINHQNARLAEALALQGRYDEAAVYEPDAVKNKFFRDLWAAVWRDDFAWCECPKKTQIGNQAIENRVFAGNIFSLKHHSERALLICNLCNFKNVADLPRDFTPHAVTQ